MNEVVRSLENLERSLSASQLRKLPVEERDAILAAQATLAAPIYRSNQQLTDFEAFGEDDLRSGKFDSTHRLVLRFASKDQPWC
jgi:hypothetical protein